MFGFALFLRSFAFWFFCKNFLSAPPFGRFLFCTSDCNFVCLYIIRRFITLFRLCVFYLFFAEYFLFTGCMGKPEITLTLINERNEISECKLKRLPYDEYLKVRKARKTFEFRILPGEIAYVVIQSFSDPEIIEEFEKTFPAIQDSKALIIDVRDNIGGSGVGQERIVGRLITKRSLVNVSYVKSGQGHDEFTRRESYYEPAGEWQYTKPVVVLNTLPALRNRVTSGASKNLHFIFKTCCRIIPTLPL